MANTAVMAYIPRKSFIHDLTGTTKLLGFLFFNLAVMVTFDTRVLICMLIFSLFTFSISKLKLSEVKVMLWFMLVFLFLNSLFIYIFAPEQGVSIYNSRTVIFQGFGKYTITLEQLFYMFNVCLKYFVSLPIAILFISTTNPSEFASSLNKIGISYKVGYAVSLALRYIPDIQRDFWEISQSQQARGIKLDKNTPIIERIKNTIGILLPLILSSLERIDIVSSAMELRGFGKLKKRTWYTQRTFKSADYISIFISIMILFFSVVVTYADGQRFFNPFI